MKIRMLGVYLASLTPPRRVALEHALCAAAGCPHNVHSSAGGSDHSNAGPGGVEVLRQARFYGLDGTSFAGKELGVELSMELVSGGGINNEWTTACVLKVVRESAFRYLLVSQLQRQHFKVVDRHFKV